PFYPAPTGGTQAIGYTTGGALNDRTAILGYGQTGTGAAGAVNPSGGGLRPGVNTIDARAGELNPTETIGLAGSPTGGHFVMESTFPVTWPTTAATAVPTVLPCTTNNTQTVTTNSTALLRFGQTVTRANVPANTFVTNVLNNTTFT